jgi:hypothetical protein
MDEPGFFAAGDDLDLDAGQAVDRRNEVPPVVSFPGGTCRAGDDLVDLVGVCDPLELGQRLESRCRGRLRKAPPVKAAGP